MSKTIQTQEFNDVLVTPATQEYFEKQLAKFQFKAYSYRTEKKVFPFQALTYGKFFLLWSGLKQWITGEQEETYEVKTPEGLNKLYEIMGSKNKSPQQSLIRLFGRENLYLTLVYKKGQAKPYRLEVGTYFNKTFIGVKAQIS